MSAITGKYSLTKMAFALVIASFILSTVVSLASLCLMLEHNVRETNRVLAMQIYDYTNSELSGPIMTARTMANNSFLVDALENEKETDDAAFEASMVRYIKSIEDGLGFRGVFVISDESGRYYTRDGLSRLIDSSEGKREAWYTTLVNMDVQYDLDVDSMETDQSSLAVYVDTKIADDDGRILGVCGIGMRVTGLQELFRTFEQSFGVKIDFVDPSGIVQVDTDSTRIQTVDLSHLVDGNKSGEYVYANLSGDGFAVTKYVDDLNWYLIVQSIGSNEASQFVNIIAINVALCAVVLVALFIALRVNRRRTEELTSASLVDHATMLSNRRAFEQDKAELMTVEMNADLVCVTADVNGLKTINDTVGHDAGDELIRGAADCLRSVFERYGTVYRVGGDEFAAMLFVPEGELDSVREELEQTVADWSGTKVKQVSVSCGYASAREFPNMSVSGLCKISDERMYESKERYYREKGIEPRRT